MSPMGPGGGPHESQERYRAIFNAMTEGFALHEIVCDAQGVPRDYRFLEINPAFERLTGLKRENVIGRTLTEVLPGEDPGWIEKYGEVALGGKPVRFEHYSPALQRHFEAFTYSPAPRQFAVLFVDVTERRRVQDERGITIEFLHLVNGSTGTRDLIQAATTYFQRRSGCEAVGIRLRQGDDYPYYEARGFPVAFVETENSLCDRDAAGAVRRDSDGNPAIACMCGNIIMGRTDPSQPFFTPFGSFWTNSSTELLASTTEADRQSRTRNRCNGEGFESVALIPLRLGGQRLGLLQLNDRRPGQFTPETIRLWERLADQLAVAVAKFLAEESLHQSEALLRAICEGSPDPVFVKDKDSRILLANPATLKAIGKPAEQIVGHKDSEFYDDPAAGLAMEANDRRIMASGLSEAVEEQVPAPEGPRVFLSTKTPYRDAAGEVVGIIGISKDITKRKMAEEAARRAEQEWVDTFNSVPDLLAVLDNDHRIVRVNRAMAERLGVKPEACKGVQCFRAVHGTDAPPECCPHTLTMTDGREHILEVFEERLGGHFLVTTTPLCDAEGRLVGSIHMARDITAQKRSENELRRTAEELARSNQELEQFAYVASHDLQEPLRMVTGFLDLLRQRHGDKLDGKAAEYVNFAMEGAQRMSQLIRDLLAYSRVQSKAWDPAPTDMKIVFERAASNCITTIRETEARVKGDGLPTVRGDPTQLVQLLQNLISNALKFRRPDVRPEVRVAARRGNDGDGDPWVFSVEDNGIGIPADQTDRVFLIFQRLHTREEYPGTGMGLAIAKRIVERHGGRIWIESRDEGGTRFMFTLPE